ncbi:MAG: AAA family ATPase, partial [Chloroflexi bacterium]|nr:AAA family ATPase [Chloroflexota bacterium]
MLQIQCLGSFSTYLDGKPLEGMKQRAEALLCYLAVTGQPQQCAHLASLLWSDTNEDKANNSLRQILHNLRTLLGDHLQFSSQAVSLSPDKPLQSDVAIFQAKLKVSTSKDLGSLTEAVALYRGDFLQGFALDDASLFEEWMLGQRERLRHQMLQALHQLAVHHTQRGEINPAMDYTLRLLELEPWREEAHRQLMLLLARSGQRSAALAQYEKCKQVLARELEVEPAQETQVLYERIKRVEQTPHNLPSSATSFVGREKELAELSQQLEDPDCRLLTIVGPGGIGKTRLALELASRKLNRFLDGVYLVPLAGGQTVEALPQAIGHAINFQFSGHTEPKRQVIRHLQDKEMLLVLDNFEHLLQGTSLLHEMSDGALQVKLLVTSRERLNVQREWLFTLEGLPFPTNGKSKDAPSYGAVQLFLE